MFKRMLCLSGCASYKANKIPTVDYPKNQNRKLTVFIKGSDTKLNNGKIGGNIESEFIKKIETTGLYSVVKIADKSNIEIYLEVEEDYPFPGSCILATFSLFIFPCTRDKDYNIKATIINNITNMKNNIVMSDGVITYHSILFIPLGFLFNSQDTVEKEVRTNLLNTIAIKAYESSTSGCFNTNECKTGFVCEASTKECKKIASEVPVSFDDKNFSFPSLVNPIDLDLLPKTVRFEHTERMNRLEKLSSSLNTERPTIEQLQVKTPNANFPIPVIRFHFDERTFFDSGSSTIRSDSNKIIDILAEQMKQDMPDTSLVILGHTDSVGSDEYNDNLSINRSASVMQQLAQRGVNLKQMSTVGIGETQPIATNATEDGRSQNRRVEFVLSRFEEANYVAIEQFPRNTEWLNNHPQTQVISEPTIQDKLPVKTKQVDNVQPKARQFVHHNTEAKKLVFFKPTKEMLTPINPEKIAPSEPITMLKESTRTVTIIPAEIVHIIPSTQN